MKSGQVQCPSQNEHDVRVALLATHIDDRSLAMRGKLLVEKLQNSLGAWDLGSVLFYLGNQRTSVVDCAASLLEKCPELLGRVRSIVCSVEGDDPVHAR